MGWPGQKDWGTPELTVQFCALSCTVSEEKTIIKKTLIRGQSVLNTENACQTVNCFWIYKILLSYIIQKPS